MPTTESCSLQCSERREAYWPIKDCTTYSQIFYFVKVEECGQGSMQLITVYLKNVTIKVSGVHGIDIMTAHHIPNPRFIPTASQNHLLIIIIITIVITKIKKQDGKATH